MFRLFTFWLTLLSTALCLFHALGFDHDNVVLQMFSIPSWVIAIFTSINLIHPVFLYALTILFWSLFGFFLDWLILKREKAY